jgi:cytochrome c556
MRWPNACVAALLVLCAGSAGLAQKVNFTPDDLEKAMKNVGQASGQVSAMIASKDFEAAKVQAARSRDQLARTISFWRNKEKEDAIKMLRDAVARLDDLDEALSTNTVDAGAVAAAEKQLGIACEACHAVYREQDPATKAFRLKPGLFH